MRWQNITLEQVKEWEKLYPLVDVAQVLRYDIPQWLDKMKLAPNRIKKIAQKKDWKKTICNWLKREQAKAVGL
jgi:predicted Zn-dependent protease